jgi:hypothetical protein
MAIDVGINPVLIREMRQAGLISADAAPKQVGPFKIYSESFDGDSSGQTKALAQTPLTGGIFIALAIRKDSSAVHNFFALTQNTHYTLSSGTLTWITDQSNSRVLFSYAY